MEVSPLVPVASSSLAHRSVQLLGPVHLCIGDPSLPQELTDTHGVRQEAVQDAWQKEHEEMTGVKTVA